MSDHGGDARSGPTGDPLPGPSTPGSGAHHHAPVPTPLPSVIMATSAASGITTRQPLPLYQQIPLPPSPLSSNAPSVSAEQLDGNGQAPHAARAPTPVSGMHTPASGMPAPGPHELMARQIAFEQHMLQQSMHLHMQAPRANEMMARLAAYEQQTAHLQQQLAQAVGALEQYRTIGSAPTGSHPLSHAISMPSPNVPRAEAMQQEMLNHTTMDTASSGGSSTSSVDTISARLNHWSLFGNLSSEDLPLEMQWQFYGNAELEDVKADIWPNLLRRVQSFIGHGHPQLSEQVLQTIFDESGFTAIIRLKCFPELLLQRVRLVYERQNRPRQNGGQLNGGQLGNSSLPMHAMQPATSLIFGGGGNASAPSFDSQSRYDAGSGAGTTRYFSAQLPDGQLRSDAGSGIALSNGSGNFPAPSPQVESIIKDLLSGRIDQDALAINDIQ